jgi:protease I
MGQLHSKRVAILAETLYQDQELWYPYFRLKEEGAEVMVVGSGSEKTYTSKFGYPVTVDKNAAEVQAVDFDAVIIPGGYAPDHMRRYPEMVALVRQAYERGRIVAAICHGGWIPISARVYRGVKVTGSPGIKDDLENAGAFWVDAPVVIDRHFVSSRKPEDLPDFCRGMLEVLSK